jgi:2-(1,2-epoxy-1,2-dihydrophenyl)acetyl-CoA isomerase
MGDSAVLTLRPGTDGWTATADRLREARREGSSQVLLIDASSGLRVDERTASKEAGKALRALHALAIPAIAAVDGTTDASGLALALACSHVSAGKDLTVTLDGTGALLALGVPWLLVDRLGAARAHALLLGPRPLTAARLAAAGLVEPSPAPRSDPLAAARVVAERLAADPGASALLRSLRAAQRSTAAQSADFDRALIALLEEGDHDVR